MFSNQHRQEVKEANPELTMVEIAKKLGEMWRGMEQDVRKEWEEKATSAKDHYMVGFACVQPALSGRVGGCAVAVTAHAPQCSSALFVSDMVPCPVENTFYLCTMSVTQDAMMVTGCHVSDNHAEEHQLSIHPAAGREENLGCPR
jgi:hypothetical protein